MKKTMLVAMIAIMTMLTIGSVFAYQYGNRTNATVDKAAAEAAIESGDYSAWKLLHADSSGKMASLINEGNFYLLKEMHEAKEAGEKKAETTEQLTEETPKAEEATPVDG